MMFRSTVSLREGTLALALLAVMTISPLRVEAQKTDRDTTAMLKAPTTSSTLKPSAEATDTAAARQTSLKAAVNPHVLTIARQRVMAMLKDPNSAQFQGLFEGYDRKKQQTVVCGYVNGKNAFGGYVGFVPFYSSDDKTEMGGRNGGLLFQRRFNQFCGA